MAILTSLFQSTVIFVCFLAIAFAGIMGGKKFKDYKDKKDAVKES